MNKCFCKNSYRSAVCNALNWGGVLPFHSNKSGNIKHDHCGGNEHSVVSVALYLASSDRSLSSVRPIIVFCSPFATILLLIACYCYYKQGSHFYIWFTSGNGGLFLFWSGAEILILWQEWMLPQKPLKQKKRCCMIHDKYCRWWWYQFIYLKNIATFPSMLCLLFM